MTGRAPPAAAAATVGPEAVSAILERHGLPRAAPQPGHNPTYPTFVCGEVVVKLFAGFPAAARAFAGERAALAAVSGVPDIPAPALLAAGTWPPAPDRAPDRAPDLAPDFGPDLAPDLAPSGAAPYLVMARVPGVRADRAALSDRQRLALAQDLGAAVARLHAVPPLGLPRPADWGAEPFAEPVSDALPSLPPHLRAQAAAYAVRLAPEGAPGVPAPEGAPGVPAPEGAPGVPAPEGAPGVFVHLDLCAQHVFVAQGRLCGLIDWGDALAGDPHLELIQLYRDTFACDGRRFAAFLEAYGWPRDAGFPARALAAALHRQAIGRRQHRSIDVFQPIAARLPLAEIPDLDTLAARLFGP
jgi:hypothetical protein